ncbi:MAG: hypothetical protein ACRDUY_05065 [Nitriliruptorales bacterium]
MQRPTHPDGAPCTIVLLEASEVEERVEAAEAEFVERLDVERARAVRQGLTRVLRCSADGR